ncbi:MAG: hypothetical protein AAB209_06225 [Bacteroidota bacterium]
MSEAYPRLLRAKERDLLDFVLPVESPGYNEYRNHIANMVVLAEGRRGRGNFVLGKQGDRADITSPLAAVIAYGIVETTLNTFTITVREFIGNQIDVEIVSSRGEEIPDHFEEKRRWTYSTWKPGLPSPATQTPVREVRINDTLVLAIARQEKRLWLYDAATMMNHLIPITNYYNELMLHKSIRDPKIALKSGLLFDELEKYSDVDLRGAFVAYNRVRKKVDVRVEETVAEEKGLKMFLRRLIGKSSF